MSSPSDNAVSLGKKLVTELGIDKSCDTLGRWMAHRITELISGAESAPEGEREAKMALCSSAVLELWGHRRSFANGRRPFEDFEPIFRALQALDPEDSGPRYYRHIRASASEEENASDVENFLQIADSLDGIARTLIRDCIVSAAANTDNKSKEWVQLAEDAVGEVDKDILVVKILNGATEERESKSLSDIQLERRKTNLEKLDAFLTIANSYAKALREEIDVQREFEES